MYHEGDLQHTTTGLETFGGKRASVDSVEWHLAKLGVVRTQLEADPLEAAPKVNVARGYVNRRDVGNAADDSDGEEGDEYE